jgi:hypothetical protein
MKLRLLVPIVAVVAASFVGAPSAQATACTHVDGLVPVYVCIPPQ